jgi:cytochrome b561
MQIKNNESRYGLVAQLFHWTIVVLVITQYVLANQAEGLPRGMQLLAVLARHKSFGMTILGLASLRLIWRLVNPVPREPALAPRWQHLASRVSHFILYAALFTTPIFGWLMSSARNFSVSWFGLFTFPNLVAPSQETYDFFHAAHEVSATVLFWVALIHIAAALKHHFYDRDNVLRRMLPVRLR